MSSDSEPEFDAINDGYSEQATSASRKRRSKQSNAAVPVKHFCQQSLREKGGPKEQSRVTTPSQKKTPRRRSGDETTPVAPTWSTPRSSKGAAARGLVLYTPKSTTKTKLTSKQLIDDILSEDDLEEPLSPVNHEQTSLPENSEWRGQRLSRRLFFWSSRIRNFWSSWTNFSNWVKGRNC